MAQKHTPGPWEIIPYKRESLKAIYRVGGPLICKLNFADSLETPAIQVANANHIVTCVNACEGINPEAVPELLAVARMLVGQVADLDEIEAMAKTAIAKAEKGGSP